MLLAASLLTAAWLTPAHWKAVDVTVVERAGEGSASLVEAGQALANTGRIGPAAVFLRAAEELDLPGRAALETALQRAVRSRPADALPMESLFGSQGGATGAIQGPPIGDTLMKRSVRQPLLEFLLASRRLGVHQLIRNRTLTNTVQFAPVASAAGQPFDAAIILAALLSRGDFLHLSLRDHLEGLAARANDGGEVQALETIYMDLLSLGRRLDWSQTTEFVRLIPDAGTLHTLVGAMRRDPERMPVVYVAVMLSGQPGDVAAYLEKHPQTGLQDLATSLRSGQGGVRELLRADRRLYSSPVRLWLSERQPFAGYVSFILPICRVTPVLAALVRIVLFLAGAFCFGRALESAVQVEGDRRPSGALRRAQWLQTSIFAVIMAAFAWFFAEPYLISERPPMKFPLRLSLPGVGEAAAANFEHLMQPFMNAATLAALFVFFTLQSVIYVWCLMKLAEIRRKPTTPATKLRLLENEEHLFDAGLYFGFVGTVVSLILVSLGVSGLNGPSIMAAYSSTSFGIIFVSVLKIFHIRPLRRELILESEPQP